MRTYTICLTGLERRRAIVVGGGSVAERKVAGLLEAGARVTVVSPTLTEALAAQAAAGQIEVVQRCYEEGDLAGAFLVVAATGDGRANARVAREAESRSLLVNVVDDPALSNFILPATVRRGELTIAVSSGGASPALARRLRERLEAELGPEYGELAGLLAELRPELRRRFATPAERQAAALDLVDSQVMDVLRSRGLAAARAYAAGWLDARGAPG